MTITRRDFLRGAGGVLTLAALPRVHASMSMPMTPQGVAPTLAPPDRPLVNPVTLARYVDALPVPSVARPSGQRAHASEPKRLLDYYRMEMRACRVKLHRDIPATSLWGYQGQFPGPTIEAQRDQPLLVEWVNALPAQHFLPIDYTVHGAGKDVPQVRTVTHLHGARVNADADGYPEHWYTPGHSALYRYGNGQDAAALWYHDHAMGITRLNIYAGLFGSYLIRDADEAKLGLPSGAQELPLMLCDRLLGTDGSLYYPVSSDPHAPWVMQLNGNLPVCNGKIFPYAEVEPRAYRLRIVNVANFSFFDLTLSHDLPLQQIGTDQGLLPAPLQRERIMLYPAERADVLIDFSAMAGKQIELRHQGKGIVQFRVGGQQVKREVLPTRLREVPRIDPAHAVKHRRMTLEEIDDASGNAFEMRLDGKAWEDPISETPVQDSIESWEFVNVTGDAHPIHLHLVRFQLLDRRPFDLFAWNARRELIFTGPAQSPEPHELGWKDTVRADPGMVTRIAMRFEGEPGRYVWHCHFLEHEDKQMMRPYQLLPK